MAQVAIDADVVIGFLDAGDDQHERAVAALRDHLDADAQLIVAASVYAEVLVRPMQRGLTDVVDEFLAATGIDVISLDRSAARLAAQLRARHRSLRLPDALALAVALAADADLLTFDERLRRVAVAIRRSGSLTPRYR